MDYQSRIIIGDEVYSFIKSNGITCILVTHDLDEGISMADKILILTKRPSRVKRMYKLEFDAKLTPLERRKSSSMSHYYKMVWSDLDVF